MTDVSQYVVQFLLNIAAFLFVARFLLQACRADFYNPLSQAIVKITDPVLKPLRMVMPGYRNIDFASLLSATLVHALLIVAMAAIASSYAGNFWQIGVLGLLETLLLILTVLKWSILIGIIASFVAQGTYHPALELIHQITEPVLAPARKLIPSAGGLDFSPILVFLMIGVIEMILPKLFIQLL